MRDARRGSSSGWGVIEGWKEKGGRILEVIQSSGSISEEYIYVENETMSVFRPSRPRPPSQPSVSHPVHPFVIVLRVNCFPEKGYFCQTAKRICILWITTCCFFYRSSLFPRLHLSLTYSFSRSPLSLRDVCWERCCWVLIRLGFLFRGGASRKFIFSLFVSVVEFDTSAGARVLVWLEVS